MLRLFKEKRRVDESALEITTLEKHPFIAKCCMLLHCAACMCFVWVAVMFAVSHAEFNGPEFRLDTDFLRWETKLPAISVCQRFGNSAPAPKDSRSCRELFLGCSWNGRPFACCDHFKELVLQDSRCFSINSQQTEERIEDTPFVIKGLDRRSELEFQFSAAVQIFVHDPKAVGFSANISTPPKFQPTGVLRHLELAFTFKELLAEEGARILTTSQRSCVLPGERSLRYHPRYSESACHVECLIQRQVQACGCSSHLLAIGSRCHERGRRCLVQARQAINDGGAECACAPECEVVDVTIVRYSLSRGQPKRHSARLTLLSPPKERLTLYARASRLDALVAFACVSRLFTSVNLLSATETIFFLVRSVRGRKTALLAPVVARELTATLGGSGDKAKLL